MDLRRGTPALIGVLMAGLNLAAWSACTSGNIGASAMACCAAAGHRCGPRVRAEHCCKSEAPADRLFVANNAPQSATPGIPADSVVAVIPSVAPATTKSALVLFERSVWKLPHQPAYLLNSVLLI